MNVTGNIAFSGELNHILSGEPVHRAFGSHECVAG